MKVGKVINTKLEIIPTANMGFIVKFGDRGRLAFATRDDLFIGLEDFILAPDTWKSFGERREEE